MSYLVELVQSNFEDSSFGGIITAFAFSIPWLICIAIGFKGFFQFWKDLKNGRSR